MAATSDEEMDSLLSTFDQIYQEFKRGAAEIESAKSASNAEARKREALEFSCNNLKQENERLTRLYTECLNNVADQLERRSTSRSLREEAKKMRDECVSKEDERLWTWLNKSLKPRLVILRLKLGEFFGE